MPHDLQHSAVGEPIAVFCHTQQKQAAEGGEYVSVPVGEGYVDGNLVTAPAWPAHPDWPAKFLQVLGAKTKPHWGL